MTSDHDLDDLDQRLLRDWRARLVKRRQRHGLLRCGLDCVPTDFIEAKRLALREDAEAEIVGRMRERLRKDRDEQKYGCGILAMLLLGVVGRLICEWLKRRIWPDNS